MTTITPRCNGRAPSALLGAPGSVQTSRSGASMRNIHPPAHTIRRLSVSRNGTAFSPSSRFIASVDKIVVCIIARLMILSRGFFQESTCFWQFLSLCTNISSPPAGFFPSLPKAPGGPVCLLPGNFRKKSENFGIKTLAIFRKAGYDRKET